MSIKLSFFLSKTIFLIFSVLGYFFAISITFCLTAVLVEAICFFAIVQNSDLVFSIKDIHFSFFLSGFFSYTYELIFLAYDLACSKVLFPVLCFTPRLIEEVSED